MCNHPVFGATSVAERLGDYTPYRLGWNVRSGLLGEQYVWIAAEEGEGLTINERPEGVTDPEINRSPPEPPFFGSAAHGFFNRAVSALAIQLDGDKRQTEVFRIHHDVLQAARVDLDQLDQWSSQIALSMDESLRENRKRFSACCLRSGFPHVMQVVAFENRKRFSACCLRRAENYQHIT